MRLNVAFFEFPDPLLQIQDIGLELLNVSEGRAELLAEAEDGISVQAENWDTACVEHRPALFSVYFVYCHRWEPLFNITSDYKSMYDWGMGRVLQFIKAAGARGWPSVIGTVLFTGISIWEHFQTTGVTSYVFALLAMAIFCWGAYAAWSEADKRAKELEILVADQYPRLQGEILRGYLDTGKRWEDDQWKDSANSAVATFYVEVVNHSAQDAWLSLPPSLRMTIGGTEYSGTRVIPAPYFLHANDPELRGDTRIIDMFAFNIGGMPGVIQKPHLHMGWLMFNLDGFFTQPDSKPEITGSATITLNDTLDGVHRLSVADLNFHLNDIGYMTK